MSQNENDIKKLSENLIGLAGSLSLILPKIQNSLQGKDLEDFNKGLQNVNSNKIISDLSKANKDLDAIKDLL